MAEIDGRRDIIIARTCGRQVIKRFLELVMRNSGEIVDENSIFRIQVGRVGSGR